MEKIFEDISNAISMAISETDKENSVRQIVKDYNATNEPQIPFQAFWAMLVRAPYSDPEKDARIEELESENIALESKNQESGEEASRHEDIVCDLNRTIESRDEEIEALEKQIRELSKEEAA